MNFPDDLRYTNDHEWIRVDGDTGTVGVTDFAQSELGDIVFVEIDSDGDTLDQDAVFGTIEAVKTVSELFMPVSGQVVEVNPALDSQPELVNEDPYGEGWLIKVSLSDPSQLDGLLSAASYAEKVSK